MRIIFKNFEDGAVIETRADQTKSTYELASSNGQSAVALMAMVALGKKHATKETIRKALLDALGHLRKQILDADIKEEVP